MFEGSGGFKAPQGPLYALYFPRPGHDARAIARARAITHANQEKGSLGG